MGAGKKCARLRYLVLSSYVGDIIPMFILLVLKQKENYGMLEVFLGSSLSSDLVLTDEPSGYVN